MYKSDKMARANAIVTTIRFGERTYPLPKFRAKGVNKLFSQLRACSAGPAGDPWAEGRAERLPGERAGLAGEPLCAQGTAESRRGSAEGSAYKATKPSQTRTSIISNGPCPPRPPPPVSSTAAAAAPAAPRPPDAPGAPADDEPIPLCATRSAPVGIFPEVALNWRHFRRPLPPPEPTTPTTPATPPRLRGTSRRGRGRVLTSPPPPRVPAAHGRHLRTAGAEWQATGGR